MSRKSQGWRHLEQAKEILSKAKTVGDFKQAQAVVLPLEYGFSIEQTASVIGVSKGWACRLRTQFIKSGGACITNKAKRGGRRRENMSNEEEKAFLTPFFEKATNGGILVVGEVKKSLDEKLGRKTALASVYNLLHRNGWHKIAPDKRNPHEARFGLISDIRRCWCPKPTRPLCSATVSQEYIYAAVSVEDGSIDTLYHMLTLIVCRFSLMSSHIGIPTTE
ncbi:MAG: hypothetical protein HQK88_07635 [Nitrospirae bacterium]|nr:hypothetical protein [Nitrospirota bacterium]MBF0521279.1 hypothetical protein [Nitrospirota bacterium]MBF0533675.1 hypothetical protein [Nitrospirota bacterium]MBF0616674.1 hypothetical protein [Nitrospirota bacterium]